MKFFAVAALATVALAQYPVNTPAEETCSQVTVTVTSTLAHTPSAPGAYNPSSAPYPTTYVPKPTAPVMGGTGKPSVPVGTGYPVVPSGGVAKPTGTGAYSAPPSQFTGAASSFKVGGVVAMGAFAAMFL